MNWKIFLGVTIPAIILISLIGLNFIGGNLKVEETSILTEVNASNNFGPNYEEMIIKTLKITNNNPFFAKNYNVPSYVVCFTNEAEDQFQIVPNLIKISENNMQSSFYIGGEEILTIPSKSSKFTDLKLTAQPYLGYYEQYTKLLIYEVEAGKAYSSCTLEEMKSTKHIQKIKINPKTEFLEPTTNPDSFNCVDSDGGKNYYTSGITTGKQKDNIGIVGLPDYCIYSGTELNGQLGENYCGADNSIQTEVYVCPQGVCANGACQQSQITCEDSDSGLDYYTFGTASLNNGENITDICLGANTLEEVYCNSSISGLLAWTYYNCSKGCMDNRCIS